MEAGVAPQDIAYTSFTNVACDEARDRALYRFPDYDRGDFPYFRTEHSICFRLLGLKRDQVFTGEWLKKFSEAHKRYKFASLGGKGLEERFDESWSEELGDRCEFFADFMVNTMLPLDEAFRRFMQLNPSTELTKGQALDYLDKRIQFKAENSLWDFSDMLVGTLKQGLHPPVNVLIIDECQDLSPLLYALVQMWSQCCERVYLAGDPYQSIYGFAGASPDLFFEFDAEQELLGHSHRLTPEVKAIAEKIITSAGLPFPSFTTDAKSGTVSRMLFSSIDWKNVGR